MNSRNDEQDDGLVSEESKSQRKRRMTELQDIGEQLLTLNERQLSKIELPDRLRAALQEYQRLPNRHEAQRRQRQFIGKLMRGSDHENIRLALERLLAPSQDQTRRSQEIERWGKRLLEGGEDDIQAFLERYPTAERQPLRTLVRRYQAVASEQSAEGQQTAQSQQIAQSPQIAQSQQTASNADAADRDTSAITPAKAATDALSTEDTAMPVSSEMVTARRRLLDYIKGCIQL